MEEQERLSVPDAAARLGTTEGALRKRIARGTLPHERDAEGRVWVLLEPQPGTGTHWEATGQDTGNPAGQDPTWVLIEELRDRVRSLEEANKENRRIIAALTSRIPQLEAPQESGQEPPEGQDIGEDEPAPQEPVQQPQRPWWQRWFGS